MFTEKEYENMSREEAFSRLPPKLQEYIEQTKRPFARITVEPAQHELELTASKFGGVPFIPEGNELPVDDDGVTCILYAQINFRELAKVVKLKELPESGLLQIFMSIKDDVFGYGTKVKQRGCYVPEEKLTTPNVAAIEKFRDWYHEIRDFHIAKHIENDSYRSFKTHGDIFTPIYKELELSFQFNEMGASSICHGEFDHAYLYEELYGDFEEDNELFWGMTENELLYDKVTGYIPNWHHILGYPQGGDIETEFDHNDRFIAEQEGRHIMRADPMVLLAVDSQFTQTPMIGGDKGHWLIDQGDADIMHFSISKADLENRNFSNITLEIACR